MDTEKIIEAFCEGRMVDKQSIYSRDRYMRLCYTRYMIWYYLHYNKGVSAGKIASMFGRNVPSIFRGIRLLRHQLAYYGSMRSQYHAIAKKIEDVGNAVSSTD